MHVLIVDHPPSVVEFKTISITGHDKNHDKCEMMVSIGVNKACQMEQGKEPELKPHVLCTSKMTSKTEKEGCHHCDGVAIDMKTLQNNIEHGKTETDKPIDLFCVMMKRLIPDDADGKPSSDCVGKVKFELKSGHVQPIGDNDVPKDISCESITKRSGREAASAVNQLSMEFSTFMVAIVTIISGIISLYFFF